METRNRDSRVGRMTSALSLGLWLAHPLQRRRRSGTHNRVNVNTQATQTAQFKDKHEQWHFPLLSLLQNCPQIAAYVCSLLWFVVAERRTTRNSVSTNVLRGILTVVITKSEGKNRDANAQKETTARRKLRELTKQQEDKIWNEKKWNEMKRSEVKWEVKLSVRIEILETTDGNSGFFSEKRFFWSAH